MKTGWTRACRGAERGWVASLIVLILLLVVVALVASNTVAVQNLRRELRLVEQRQIQHYGTNAVTNLTVVPVASSRR
ncbi:MAG: hypothetical protein ABSC03_06950 [Verrucomicrobiota bacterium]|jgi:hypothetical protein